MADSVDMTKLLAATKGAAAASIAGGMIAATNRAHSVKEALDLYANVYVAMFPEGGSRQEAFAKAFDVNATHK